MTTTRRTALSRFFRLGALSALWCTAVASPTFAASVFANYAGSWHGGGTVSLTDGSREAIRCRATYRVQGDGAALGVDVNCASDSYRVHIVANVVAQGTSFAGSWQELTRQIGGDVTGLMSSPGELQATFQTMGGGLQLGARVAGRRQVVTIHSQGSDIQAVDIAFTR